MWARFVMATMLALLLAGGAALYARQPGSALFVAVVRTDGMLLPIAVRERGAWSPLQESPSGDAIALRPAGRQPTGMLWRMADGNSLRIHDRMMIPSRCLMQEAYSTLPGSSPATPSALPVKAGIAILGLGLVERALDALNDDDGLVAEVRELIVSLVNREEERLMRQASAGVPPVLPSIPAAMRTRWPEVLKLSRHRIGESEWFLFEARKRYPELVQDGCPAGVLVKGWVASIDGKAPLAVAPVAGVAGCVGTAWASATPLGVVRFGNRAVWVVQQDLYEGEQYELIETSLERAYVSRAVTAYGGGC